MRHTDMLTIEPPSATRPETDPAAAHRAAASRDPRNFPFGYLAGDSETGALAPTVWCASAEELIAFLLETEVALLQFDEADTARITASLERAIGATRDPRRLCCGELTDAFEGWCEILWIGTFADLCTTGGSMPKSLRLAFREDVHRDAHAGPIADDEIDGVVAWLRGV